MLVPRSECCHSQGADSTATTPNFSNTRPSHLELANMVEPEPLPDDSNLVPHLQTFGVLLVVVQLIVIDISIFVVNGNAKFVDQHPILIRHHQNVWAGVPYNTKQRSREDMRCACGQ